MRSPSASYHEGRQFEEKHRKRFDRSYGICTHKYKLMECMYHGGFRKFFVNIENKTLKNQRVEWCGRRDSNSHTLRHWNLNPACLPISPRPLNQQQGWPAFIVLGYCMCNGVDDGVRTHDHRNHNPGLYQLSYAHHYHTTFII